MALFRLVAAASTNATSITARRTRVNKIVVSNNSGTVHHLKLYDKATAPTVGTDVPVLSLFIGINSSSPQTFILSKEDVIFYAGLGIGIVGGNTAADSDTTAATANAVIVHIFYGD